MNTETFKSAYANITKLTENKYPMWKEKVRWVIMGADAYDIITRAEPEPETNTNEGRTKLRNRRKWLNNAQSIIYMGCSDQIVPDMKHTINPAEMWDIRHDRFDNTFSKLSWMQILRQFHRRHPAKDDLMTIYLTCRFVYRNQLSGSSNKISEDRCVTHLFTHVPKEFATMINIFERQASPPTSQHIKNAIWLAEEMVAFVTQIADASTRNAHYSQRGGSLGHGRGRGCSGSGRFGRQETYRCTYCMMDNHTTEEWGKRKRA